MSDLDLEAIKARAGRVASAEHFDAGFMALAVGLGMDVPALIAELERYQRLFGESSYADAMQALTDARGRIQELETTLCEVLRTFYDKGHPGYPAYRSTWVRVESLEKWRRTAAGGETGA